MISGLVRVATKNVSFSTQIRLSRPSDGFEVPALVKAAINGPLLPTRCQLCTGTAATPIRPSASRRVFTISPSVKVSTGGRVFDLWLEEDGPTGTCATEPLRVCIGITTPFRP